MEEPWSWEFWWARRVKVSERWAFGSGAGVARPVCTPFASSTLYQLSESMVDADFELGVYMSTMRLRAKRAYQLV